MRGVAVQGAEPAQERIAKRSAEERPAEAGDEHHAGLDGVVGAPLAGVGPVHHGGEQGHGGHAAHEAVVDLDPGHGEQAAEDLQASLGCQPFMAKITRTDGRNVYINSGADAGLRPGDTLNIYRLSTFYDNQQNPYTELENVKLVLTLKKVQPFFARGQVATDPDKIGIQQGDVVIAW